MKNWGSALFPVTILAVLAALTFWLRYATELPEPQRDGKNRHDPDYIISGATLRKLDPAGNLQYTLKADDIRHYPDDDTTDMLKPDVVYLRPPRPPVSMSAERGHMSKDGERVDLYDNVRIFRAASGKDEAMTAVTSELTVLPDEEKAFTKEPVVITQGDSWLKGSGLQVDNKAQTYLLESRASAMLKSKHAKKKTP
jgi:lipopolysaccharide export system protein LptC